MAKTTNNLVRGLESITKKYGELRTDYNKKVVSSYDFNPDNENLALYQVARDSQKTITEDCKEILASYTETEQTNDDLLEKEFYESQRKQANAYLVQQLKPLTKLATELKKCLMSTEDKAEEVAKEIFKEMFSCELSTKDYNKLVDFLSTVDKRKREVKEQATSPLDLFYGLATSRKAFIGDLSTKSAKAMTKKAYSKVVVITEEEWNSGNFQKNNQTMLVDELISKANIKTKATDSYIEKADKVRKAVKSGKIALKPNTLTEKEEKAKAEAKAKREQKAKAKEQKA